MRAPFHIIDPLPDIFTGLKCGVSEELSVDVRNKLKRYIIAYGGEVLEEFHKAEADFIIKPSTDVSESASKENYTTEDWVWEKIKSVIEA